MVSILPSQALRVRQSDDSNATASSQIIIAAVIIGVLGVILITLGIFTYLRKKRNIDRHRRLESADDNELQQQSETGSAAPAVSRRQNGNSTTAPVSHRLSTRSIASIVTLPPYKETPGEAEEVIAREGERAGLDYIVEGPETVEELENRRQEEVAAIYRVQQTRRRELEERAERRRARRTALESQDYREVARLDRAASLARQRERSGSSTSVGQPGRLGEAEVLNAVAEGLQAQGLQPSSGTLLAELAQIRSRGRRTSSVAYADVGVQRHDGSRLRAQSVESDSQPLLDSAGTPGRISGDFRSTRSRASSVASNNMTLSGGRERSRSRASLNGADEDPRVISMQLSEDGIPAEPPSYDDDLSVHGHDAPRYEDVVLETSRPTTAVSQSSNAHPHAGVHDGEDASNVAGVERTPAGPKPSAIPLSLRTNVSAPSIEVVSATPTQSRPATPVISGAHP